MYKTIGSKKSDGYNRRAIDLIDQSTTYTGSVKLVYVWTLFYSGLYEHWLLAPTRVLFITKNLHVTKV